MKIFNKDIEILGDDEGFIILICPYCKSEFKVSANDLQDNGNIYNELFCPYCGLTKETKYFYTREIKSKATKVGRETFNSEDDKIHKNNEIYKGKDKKTLKPKQEGIYGISNLSINQGPKLYGSKCLDMSFSNMEKQIEKDKPLYKIKIDNKKLQNINVDRLQDKNLKEVEYKCDICSSKEKVLSDEKTIIYCAYCGVSLK